MPRQLTPHRVGPPQPRPAHRPLPPPRSGEKPASDVLAGALARAASQSTIHPIDTIKVRMQSGSSAGSSKVPQLVTPPLAGAGVRDALGRAPSARVVLSAASDAGLGLRWARLAQTEVAEKSSNPVYLRTIAVRFVPLSDVKL